MTLCSSSVCVSAMYIYLTVDLSQLSLFKIILFYMVISKCLMYMNRDKCLISSSLALPY